MWIFDRWGNKIFNQDGLEPKWDGVNHNNGIACQEGVYVYLITVHDIFGKKHEYAGRVTLLR